MKYFELNHFVMIFCTLFMCTVKEVRAEGVLRNVSDTGSNKYIVLRSDISFAKQVTAPNTYFVVRFDFNLGGETVRIPSGCELKFEGGSLGNGTIECNNTIINGCYNCLKPSLKIKGGHSSIDLAWLGVIGTNPNNTEILKSLSRIDGSTYEAGRSFYLTDDIICSEGDIILPWNVTIDGRNHTITFSCNKAKNALLCLSQNTNLQNIKIRVSSTMYSGACILCDSQLSNMEIFKMCNVDIFGPWSSNHDYKVGCGIKIVAHNNGDNLNCFTNCRLRDIRIYHTNIGIELICDNSIIHKRGKFAWMNQIYIDGLFVQSNQVGLKTLFKDNSKYPSNSVGPIFISYFEHQAASDALMFRHEGNWSLYLNTCSHYDSRLTGEIFSGNVYADNLTTCISSHLGAEGVDNNGSFKLQNGIKVYQKGRLYLSGNHTGIKDFISDVDYNTSTGTPSVQMGFEGGAFQEKAGYLNKKWYTSQPDQSKHQLSTVYRRFYTIYDDKETTGSIIQIVNKEGSYKIYSIMRTIPEMNGSNVSIQESNRCTELYKYVYSEGIREGVFKLKLKMIFRKDGKVINWATYRSIIDRVASMNLNFNRVFIKDINNIQSYYTVEKDELYLNIIGYNQSNLNTAVIYFDMTYKDYLEEETDIIFKDNGEPTLLINNDAYLYGVSAEKADFNNRDCGFEYLNTSITPSRPVWWTGSSWVDAMGNIIQ